MATGIAIMFPRSCAYSSMMQHLRFVVIDTAYQQRLIIRNVLPVLKLENGRRLQTSRDWVLEEDTIFMRGRVCGELLAFSTLK